MSHAREVARAAAQWLALMESGAATERDEQGLQAWRDSHQHHERAWQKALLLRQRFAGLPSTLAMATLDRPDMARRAALKRALGIAAVLPAAWLVSRQLPLDVWRADLQTATGERLQRTLADGSDLQLNTDTALNLDLAARQLTLLRGEMSLKVSGDTPLTIQLPYGRLRVSRSEVCVRLNDQDCHLAVLGGAVPVTTLGAEQIIHAGQHIRLQESGAGPVEPLDSLLLGWRNGMLMADDQALGDFLRELRRYRPGLLRWDRALESLRVTGSFRLDDTDRVLALLAASLPLEVQSRTRYWVTLVPRPEQPEKTFA